MKKNSIERCVENVRAEGDSQEVRESPTEKGTVHQYPDEGEAASHVDDWARASSRRNSKGKGREAGPRLACLRICREANAVGSRGMRGSEGTDWLEVGARQCQALWGSLSLLV